MENRFADETENGFRCLTRGDRDTNATKADKDIPFSSFFCARRLLGAKANAVECEDEKQKRNFCQDKRHNPSPMSPAFALPAPTHESARDIPCHLSAKHLTMQRMHPTTLGCQQPKKDQIHMKASSYRHVSQSLSCHFLSRSPLIGFYDQSRPTGNILSISGTVFQRLFL